MWSAVADAGRARQSERGCRQGLRQAQGQFGQGSGKPAQAGSGPKSGQGFRSSRHDNGRRPAGGGTSSVQHLPRRPLPKMAGPTGSGGSWPMAPSAFRAVLAFEGQDGRGLRDARDGAGGPESDRAGGPTPRDERGPRGDRGGGVLRGPRAPSRGRQATAPLARSRGGRWKGHPWRHPIRDNDNRLAYMCRPGVVYVLFAMLASFPRQVSAFGLPIRGFFWTDASNIRLASFNARGDPS